MLEAAARNRLKVALSQLRRLGLAEVIETAPTGYRLTPRCRVVLVEDREDAAH